MNINIDDETEEYEDEHLCFCRVDSWLARVGLSLSWSLPSSRFRPFLINLKGGLFDFSNVALAFLTKPLSILLGLVFPGEQRTRLGKPLF